MEEVKDKIIKEYSVSVGETPSAGIFRVMRGFYPSPAPFLFQKIYSRYWFLPCQARRFRPRDSTTNQLKNRDYRVTDYDIGSEK
jgi:hypothetical protein